MQWWRSRSRDAEIERELEADLAIEEEELREQGMSAEEARHAARRAFGNTTLLREQTHAVWAWSWLEALLYDLRYSLRTLRRTPGFTVIAILVMALGIGANVALFSVVRGVLLKPLPYADPSRLIMLYETSLGSGGTKQYAPVDPASFFEWQRASTGVEQMAMVSPFQNYNVSAEGGKLPERIDAGWCSWNFFSILGVQPALGRTFSSSDDQGKAQATVILTNSFWRRRYASDPAIIGKTIYLDAHPYTVIGVLPASFIYSGSFGGKKIQVWTPFNHEAPPSLLATYEDHEAIIAARLKPDATLESVVSQISALQQQIKKAHPQPGVHTYASGRPMLDDVVENYKTPLYVLLAATGCVLLIACMNVASLLIARTAARSKEMAIRAALGGGRIRLLRARLIESAVLTLAAGVIGVLLAWAGRQFLIHFQPEMNRIESIRIDGGVVLFTLSAIAACALFTGIISALSSDSKQLLGVLQEASRASRGSNQRATMRKVLLVFEIGLTVMLLAGAGLLLKSYQRMRSADLGVPVENTLTLHLSLPDGQYSDPVKQEAFFSQLIERVRALPGVKAAGLVSTAPGQGWGGDSLADVVEQPRRQEDFLDMHMRGAETGYFSAAQIALLRGRLFTQQELVDGSKVALISRAAVQSLFPNQDPIGKHLKFNYTNRTFEIVGVVEDTRWDLSSAPKPTLYMPLYKTFTIATIFVRGNRNVESLATPIEKIIGQLDRDLPVSNVMTLNDTIAKATLDSQFNSLLVLGFAAIALVLAAAGLYGVLAYLAAQRTGEIGIRIALGSPRPEVLRLMLFDGLRPALLGMVLGLGASVAVSNLIRSMLYETEPTDLNIYATVILMLLLVATAACMLPAWRASRLDPMTALRTE